MANLPPKSPLKAVKPVTSAPVKAPVTTETVEAAEKPASPMPAPAAKPVTKTVAVFDFAAFKAKSVELPPKPKPLLMLVTGRRGGGKSFSLGTCSGDLILFCSRQEHHSYQAALAGKMKSGNPHSITPMWIDKREDDTIIDDADQVWQRVNDRLEALINTPDVEKLFPFLAFDSLNAFERYTGRIANVRVATQFQKTAEATSNLIQFIIDKLLRLHSKGMHIIVTMASEVKERPDGSLSLVPMLTGYRAADEVIGSFPDIAVATCVQVVENEGEAAKNQHVFQFKNAEGSKSGKKFGGEMATTTFTPRLQSIPEDILGQYLDANIGTTIQYIEETFDAMLPQNTQTGE